MRRNPPRAENGRYYYVTSCVSSTYKDMRDMLDDHPNVDVSMSTFKKAIGSEAWKDITAQLGYDRDFSISKDGHVRYYKATYRGVPAYYLRHSGIEHIYTLDGKVGPSLAETRSNPWDPVEEAQEGQCFRWATMFANTHGDDDAVVVHGWVTGGHPPRRFQHAWVEQGNKVFDNNNPKGVNRKKYLAALAAEPVSRYPADVAMRTMIKAGNHGPWEEDEIVREKPAPSSTPPNYVAEETTAPPDDDHWFCIENEGIREFRELREIHSEWLEDEHDPSTLQALQEVMDYRYDRVEGVEGRKVLAAWFQIEGYRGLLAHGTLTGAWVYLE